LGDQSLINEIAYTGGIYDADTALYYLNARYYDPDDGRFMTQDTYRGESTSSENWNLYAYSNGDPINRIDPSGHKSFEAAWNLPKAEPNDALKISIKGKKIIIKWKAHFKGKKMWKKAKSVNSNKTYASVIKGGIQKYWKGSKFTMKRGGQTYKKIKLTTKITAVKKSADDAGTVTFHNSKGVSNAWYAFDESNGEIDLYKGDSRPNSTSKYTYKQFQVAAAHEFGHVLGILDGYDSKKTRGIASIMCDPFDKYDKNGKERKVPKGSQPVTSKDVKKALAAYKSKEWKSWP
jgi:RHS repeat-associated protein